MYHLLRCSSECKQTLLREHKSTYLEKLCNTSSSFCLASSGRASIYALINILSPDSISGVLLPAYIAEGVIRPFLAMNIPTHFYNLKKNLFPDEKSITEMIESKSIKLLVIVHPLGNRVDISEIKWICEKNKILILEDFAQTLFVDRTEFIGDFTLFSFNKFLPVHDGALLLSHRNDISLKCDMSAMVPLPDVAIKAYDKHLEYNYLILQESDQSNCRVLLKKTEVYYNQYYFYLNSDFSQARVSQETEHQLPFYDIDELFMRRKKNQEILYQFLNSTKIDFLYPEIDDKNVPMAVPIVLLGTDRSEFVKKAFIKGVLLSSLIDKWNFIPEWKSGRFENEMFYINNHLLLPINEFYDSDDIAFIAEVINSI